MSERERDQGHGDKLDDAELEKRLLSRAAAAESMIPRVGGVATDAGRTFEKDARLFRDAAELIANLAKAYVAERDALLAVKAERLSARSAAVAPIPMVLYCPACGSQHVDEPDDRTPGWTNPPHRSHLCHACKCIWRPADVATVGVEKIETHGKADTWSPFGRCPATPHEHATRSASERTDGVRLLWLETLLKHCPHADLTWNDDADEGPLGWRLLVESCSRLDLRAPTLEALIDLGMKAEPDEDGDVVANATDAVPDSRATPK